MDVEAYLVAHCPAEIVSEVKAADLRRPAEDDIFYIVESQDAGPVCVSASTLYLAPKMTARVHDTVQTGFLTSVATYAGLFPAEALPMLADAMTRLPRSDQNSYIYFAALRLNQLDLRHQLAGTILPDWSFAHPRDTDATTWHYHLYLASLGDTDALDALIAKIDSTEDATNAYSLLTDLAELPDPRVTQVLRRYAGDDRLTRGPNGPGASLGELAQILLDQRV